jgi:hypothetical protein
VVCGTVIHGDVTWKLRTRLDAVPTLGVVDGAVTAWIRDELLPDGNGPNAVVEVESAVIWVRARIAAEDPSVVITSPIVALDAYIPDGTTDRHVIRLEGDKLWVDVGMPGVSSTALGFACDRVGLERTGNAVGSLLPPPVAETVVRPTANVHTPMGDLPVARFAVGHGSEVPRGLVVTLHE